MRPMSGGIEQALRVVLDTAHPDFDWSAHESVRDARHKYRGKDVIWHEVADSREGWAKAVELYELLASEKVHRNRTLVLDFSLVRPKGAPIKGMQNRPSSGPVPLMNALLKVASIRDAGMAPWLQALYVDHYLAECVLVGGARRAARLACKHWQDPDILEFIAAKRPVEYLGLSAEQVLALRAERRAQGLTPPFAFLWSASNSVLVDAEFWNGVAEYEAGLGINVSPEAQRAHAVFTAAVDAAYADGTGEPGFINADQLVANDAGLPKKIDGEFAGYDKYQPEDDTKLLLARVAKRARKKPYRMIVNPCGEITLSLLGGYCVIADVVPFHADTLAEAEEAFRVATRALIRTNLMPALYQAETSRTNRIGVGMTGVMEFAWKFFQVGFKDLIDPDFAGHAAWRSGEPCSLRTQAAAVRAAHFWHTLALFARAVEEEAASYSAVLGLPVPHTNRTIKPAGTTSKLFGLCEGWHLPSMRRYVRWVQFRSDDPLVADYAAKGYPVRALKSYEGTTIVGFPTEPTICQIGMPDELIVTASEATPEEQYQWLRLGERFWLRGTQENGVDLPEDHGNQISDGRYSSARAS